MSIDISVVKVLIQVLWADNVELIREINSSIFRICSSCRDVLIVHDLDEAVLNYCKYCHRFTCTNCLEKRLCCKLPFLHKPSLTDDHIIEKNIIVSTASNQITDKYRLNVLILIMIIKNRQIYYKIMSYMYNICPLCETRRNVYKCSFCYVKICSICAKSLYQSKKRPCDCSLPKFELLK